METIRVNMTPCEDIKTIHASQNDNEAREWGFEIHNNGEKIDSSSISDQMVFKAYEGGTEEILPTNGSVPTTAPFLGDIRYPQGLLTDQEFTYRQSPTEEDGLAKIESIKGNTLNWNQLVNNGNFASATGWKTINTSISVANNKATITISGNGAVIYNEDIYFQKNHKILVMLNTDNTSACSIRMYSSAWAEVWYRTMNRVGNMQYSFIEPTDNTKIMYLYLNRQVGDVVTVENIQAFDLTQMGLDISNPSDFTSLFSLPYYDYNQGTLLSFMGNGIKTVGKNLLDHTATSRTQNGVTFTVNEDKSVTLNGTCSANTWYRLITDMPIVANTSYVLSGCPQGGGGTTYRLVAYLQSGARADDGYGLTFTDTKNTLNIDLVVINGAVLNNLTFYPMVRYANVPDSTYEPYTSSTLSLPISTYFPNGMKSAGSVYDELTETKAITRVGNVDLGTLDWSYLESVTMFMASLPSMKETNNKNIICPIYQTVDYWVTSAEWANNNMIMTRGGNDNNIRIKNTSYNTATAFKTAMSGVPLYFELATYEETSFTTASLVTENAEIPLSNEDGVLIGKCTEQLSSESGFFDAKIKLADSDGECYSNKIQLHVERKPS